MTFQRYDAADPKLPLDQQLLLACGGDAAILFDRDVALSISDDPTWLSADTKVMVEGEHQGRRYFGVYVTGLLVAIWNATSARWHVRGGEDEDLSAFRSRALGPDGDPVGDAMGRNQFNEWTYGPVAPSQMACVHFPNCRTVEEHDARNVEQAALIAANRDRIYRAFDDDADRDEED